MRASGAYDDCAPAVVAASSATAIDNVQLNKVVKVSLPWCLHFVIRFVLLEYLDEISIRGPKRDDQPEAVVGWPALASGLINRIAVTPSINMEDSFQRVG
jgi:hypothetical protein